VKSTADGDYVKLKPKQLQNTHFYIFQPKHRDIIVHTPIFQTNHRGSKFHVFIIFNFFLLNTSHLQGLN